MFVRAGGAGPQIIDTINRSSTFRIIPFDTLAAIEAAQMTRVAIETGNKRGGSDSTWAKMKFDRQIVAIAKVARARVIYSDDADVRAIAATVGITVIGTVELPLPPKNLQIEMPLNSPTAPGSASPVDTVDETEGEDADDEINPAEGEAAGGGRRDATADESGDEKPGPDGNQ